MIYYLSLGSNLGECERHLREATRLLQERAGEVLRCSSFFYSEPWGFQSENSFCNCCLALQTTLQPLDLLHLTQQIEREMGRTIKSSGVGDYHDRIIDIDLLLCYLTDSPDSTSLPLSRGALTLPHPLMRQRDFVMVPLREIIPPGLLD